MDRRRSARALRATLLVLFAALGVTLIALYVVAPGAVAGEVDSAARQGTHPLGATLYVAAVCVLVIVLAVGVARGWRWLFWLVLIAFLAQPLAVVADLLTLAGIVPSDTPAWYTALRLVISAALFPLGLWMLTVYRRAGVWGMRGRRAAPTVPMPPRPTTSG